MKYSHKLDELIADIIYRYYELRKLDRIIVRKLYYYIDAHSRLLIKYIKKNNDPLMRIFIFEEKTRKKKILEEIRDIMGKNIKTSKSVRPSEGRTSKIKPPTWAHLIRNIKDQLKEDKVDDAELIKDCQSSMAYRMYQIAMGKIVPSFHEVNAITFMLEKSVSETENIMDLLADEDETYNLDSPEGINRLATRVVTLHLEGYLSLKTAERLLDILQQKITFSETAHLLPNFDEYKKNLSRATPIVSLEKKNKD